MEGLWQPGVERESIPDSVRAPGHRMYVNRRSASARDWEADMYPHLHGYRQTEGKEQT